MLRTLVRKEMLFYWRFRWATRLLVPCFAVFLLCAYLQARDFGERVRSCSLLVNDAQGDQGHSRGPNVVFAPAPLSVLAKGLDVQAGTTNLISPLSGLFVSLDLAGLVRVLFGLVALLVGAVSVAAELEQGTLRAVLSYPVPRSCILVSKWIAISLMLLGLLSAAFLVFVGILYLSGHGAIADDDVIDLVFLFGVSTLYLVIFLGLGMVLSALLANSKRAAAVSLLLWILLLFVIPSLASLTTAAFLGVPRAETVMQRKYLARMEVRLLAARGGIGWQEYGRRVRDLERTIDEDYRRAMQNYVRSARNLARMSPASCYLFAATSCAGTGLETWEQRRTIQGGVGTDQVPVLMRPTRHRGEMLQSAAADVMLLIAGCCVVAIMGHAVFQGMNVCGGSG